MTAPDFDSMSLDEAAEWMDAHGDELDWQPAEMEVSPNLIVTVGGRILAEEDIQRLASEAEAGYDPDQLVERKITPP